jgi:hypothetical protein
MAGTAALFVATLTAYLGLRLYRGTLHAYRDLSRLAPLQVLVVGATIGFGHWLLPYYRAAEGPRDYFLRTNPALHYVYFEFKELAALQAFALSVATAVLLVRERSTLPERDDLRRTTGVLLMLCWLLLGAAYGLGAALTKLRSV